jgi:hypothetical protein
MMNNGNYNINNGDDNNIRNPPPPTLEHVTAIQGQLFQNHGANATDHSTDIVHGRKNPVKKEEQ